MGRGQAQLGSEVWTGWKAGQLGMSMEKSLLCVIDRDFGVLLEQTLVVTWAGNQDDEYGLMNGGLRPWRVRLVALILMLDAFLDL